jgi:DNA processing protein
VVKKKKYITLTPLEKKYPYRLQFIPNPPPNLWIKGDNLDLFNQPTLAVVGSRKPSKYGQKVTQKIVSQLVKRGFVIVSGMARGIDSIAHRSTLKNKGQTIAVLGSGLNVIYPPENKKLFNQIQLVVSEFPPSTKPKGNNFLSRNRIISGLSDGVVVIEAARRSGTLNTARHAAEQGKEVFAVPGPITLPTSEGTAWLIKQGAKLIYDIEDILNELP